MVTKKQLINYFKNGGSVTIVTPTHPKYNISRKADRIQTNSLRFEGGSWLYFNGINGIFPINIFDRGFKITDLKGGFIEYSIDNIELLNKGDIKIKGE